MLTHLVAHLRVRQARGLMAGKSIQQRDRLCALWQCRVVAARLAWSWSLPTASGTGVCYAVAAFANRSSIDSGTQERNVIRP